MKIYARKRQLQIIETKFDTVYKKLWVMNASLQLLSLPEDKNLEWTFVPGDVGRILSNAKKQAEMRAPRIIPSSPYQQTNGSVSCDEC